MINEITIGETPMETNLVGASAAPSHAPAVNPHRDQGVANSGGGPVRVVMLFLLLA